MTLTGKLVRAARALTAWTQTELGEASGVPASTIRAFEAGQSRRLMSANERLLIAAFEKAGVEFVPENGGGAGVRYARPGETAAQG